MDLRTRQAEEFERERPQLWAVAYRLLGSASEADDAVQEAWLRLSRSDGQAIDNLGGWLTTVVGRVCIDMLRARRARREEPVAEPPRTVAAAAGDGDPEAEALLADTVGAALLVVLDALGPAERLAFVLHDMFGVPFEDIAPIVDRSPAATRQLASRARRRVRGAAAGPAAAAVQRDVVAAFLAASRAGDFDALLALLDPEVVFRADARARARLVPARIDGAAAVARHAAEQGPRFATLCHPALVDGAPGVVIRAGDRRIGEVAFVLRDGAIAALELRLAA